MTPQSQSLAHDMIQGSQMSTEVKDTLSAVKHTLLKMGKDSLAEHEEVTDVSADTNK